MSEWLLVLSLLVAGGGATSAIIGYIFGIVTLAGLNRVWGIAAMFVPVVAIVGFVVYRQRIKYPLRLLVSGLLVLAISAPLVYHFALEYTVSIKS